MSVTEVEFPVEVGGQVFESWEEFKLAIAAAISASDMRSYQEAAASTAVYPHEMTISDFGILYCTLGLNGEAGEIAEEIKKMYRDDQGELTFERRDRLEKELGDVLWYLSQLCGELKLTLDSVALVNLLKLSLRQQEDKFHGSGSNR